MTTKHQDERKRKRQGDDAGVLPVSHSRLSRYETCPAWFKYEYVDRLPRVGGIAADLGTSLHSYAEARLRGEDPQIPALDNQQLDDYRRMVKAIDDTLAESSANLAALEETITTSWDLPDGRKAELEVRIDVLQFTEDDTAIITDYKTGYRVPTDLTDDAQGLRYAVAVVRHYPRVWRVIFKQVQARFGRTLTTTFSLERIEQYEQHLLALIEKVAQDNEFKPQPGDHCRICPFSVGHCEVGKSLRGRGLPVLTQDDAVREAQELAYLEAMVDRKKAALKIWCEDNGPVDIGASWYGFSRRKSLRIPKDKLYAAETVLEEYGVDPSDVIENRFNYVTGRKFLYGKRAIPELRDLADEVIYTTFDLRRKDADGD